MSFGGFFGIMSAIVGVAFLATALSSTNTATIITSVFNGFTGSLRAAMGH